MHTRQNHLFFKTLLCLLVLNSQALFAQKTYFYRDISPAEGIVTPQEKPYRDEICLNGQWSLQCIPLPASWKHGSGVAPELSSPQSDKWEKTAIKIPSPININAWGNGFNVGEGTENPYAPSSVYYPSYPAHWVHTKMAWMKRNFTVPEGWNEKRIVLHFEAVAGECRVLINGKEVCRNFDTFMPFDADITDVVNIGGRNEILVGVRHPKLFDNRHPEYPKMEATYPLGSYTENLIGIWQDVYLWALPQVRVEDVFVQPLVDKGELRIELNIKNTLDKDVKINLSGDVKTWINKSGKDIISAPEVNWDLGKSVLKISGNKEVKLSANESRKVILIQRVDDELKYWSPESPNLYTLLLNIGHGKMVYDCKATRFGWRQFKIVGKDFYLNGKPIKCYGDFQHPFSAYVCSRRFAYAWYKVIKDFGGNSVRPHAQPWPRMYYDLADEMGLLVIDETGLFGSSIHLNFEDERVWTRTHDQLHRLIDRDKNHPSVIGWSAGNETFAIALLNKPTKAMSDAWNDKLVELAMSVKKYDTTRDFITLDGDRDMDGRLPVWSRHLAHGNELHLIPKDLNKPLVVGEAGATYYGRPSQLYQFSGERAFFSYEGRNEALGVDLYQNIQNMAKPYLSYFSSSEVAWYGLEHLNLGYHDFTRLPNLTDGIFPAKNYEDGKPGYQFERIPPYVTTLNPGLDPLLPFYKPLGMFNAMKDGINDNGKNSYKWTKEYFHKSLDKPVVKNPIYKSAYIFGSVSEELLGFIDRMGISLANNPKKTKLWIIDIENITQEQAAKLSDFITRCKEKDGMLLALGVGNKLSNGFLKLAPKKIELTSRKATALENNKDIELGRYFELQDIYFGELEGDRNILKAGLKGDWVDNGYTVFKASRTDWSLFNNVSEDWKCAQVVLYESLIKPEGTALFTYYLNNVNMIVSVIDYRISTNETNRFWSTLLRGLRIEINSKYENKEVSKKEHDLLMDGPVS